MTRVSSLRLALGFGLALAAPAGVTAAILRLQPGGPATNYTFLYLGVITVIALAWGLAPAVVAAVASTIAIDYYFVPPVGTFTISSPADIQNLVVFVLAALVLGFLADARRRQEHQARVLLESLRETNSELDRRRQEAEEGRRSATELALVSARVEALAEADRLKSELLANVSHQLRTPLGAIVGMSSALLDGASLGGASREQYLETINSEGRHLARLVDGLLEMARLESGALELHLEPVDVREALESAADRARNLYKGFEVTVSGEHALAMADEDSLQEVLRNLIENAARVSRSVELSTVRTDGRVGIDVADNGPGVPESEREAIFERFYQGSSQEVAPDGPPPGSGLGLAISRRLTDAIGGTVWCEGRSGGGSVFKLSLKPFVAPVSQPS